MADEFDHDWLLVYTEFRCSLSDIIENCLLLFFMTFDFYGGCHFDIVYLEFDGRCVA